MSSVSFISRTDSWATRRRAAGIMACRCRPARRGACESRRRARRHLERFDDCYLIESVNDW